MDIIRTFGLSCVVTIVALFLNLIQMHLEDTGNHPILERILVIPIFLLFFITLPSTAVLFFLIYQYDKRHEKLVRKDEYEKQSKINAINERLLKQAEVERDYSLSSRPFLDSELERRTPFKVPFFLVLFLSLVLSVALGLSLYSLSALRSQLLHQQQEHEAQIQQVQQSSYDEGYQEGYRLGHTQGIIDETKNHTYLQFAREFKSQLDRHLEEKYQAGYSDGYKDCKSGKADKYNSNTYLETLDQIVSIIQSGRKTSP